MADRYDVAERLAEGQSALDHTQTYVQACHALGYQQPELTARPLQVSDWYGTEVGLDLRVLEGDATELRVALNALEEALWVQRSQVSELAAAWRGSGAESAARFLQRHCDAAEEVIAHVRAAAEQCDTLRDEVWRAVDGKVATTVAIDERAAAQRPTWLAAAQAVAAGDRAAEVVVHQQVMPFVDNDIRNDWLAGVSAADASVAGSYDTAIHALSSTRDVRFDIPGELGPRWQPVAEERGVVEVAPVMSPPPGPAPTVPAAVPAPRSVPDAPVDDAQGVAASPLDDMAGLSSGAGGLGGMGGMTNGVGGVFGSIVDGIGSLLGSLIGGGSGVGSGIGSDPIDLADADDPLVDGVDKPDDAEEPAALDDDVAPEAPVAESATAPAEPVAEPAAQPNDPPPADAPPPEAAPTPEGSTPCEIAEDQLPQVGQ
jgi:hypothetical protein